MIEISEISAEQARQLVEKCGLGPQEGLLTETRQAKWTREKGWPIGRQLAIRPGGRPNPDKNLLRTQWVNRVGICKKPIV